MSRNKKYYQYIDIIRVFACFGVLLYHLNILKGGYLAVCIFFVLTSYLSCISSFKKEKFSLLSYYKNRLLKIYLPLVLVVFITISVLSFFPHYTFLNLKPEVTSIFLGCNNFWQLSVNLDYFARHLSSPFMHLWYISLLLQFDLIFPFLFLPLKKLGDKVQKNIPIIIPIILSLISFLFFYQMVEDKNIMSSYYNTLTRSFSLLLGLSLGFIHSYYNPHLPSKINNKKIIFYLYIFILVLFFIFIPSTSSFMPFAMLITTLITCRLITYAHFIPKGKKNNVNKTIKNISTISYEIYLFQYPLIYFFQYLKIAIYLKVFLIIIIIFILSYLLHYALKNSSHQKKSILKYTISIIIAITSLYGAIQYIITKDHTKELKLLEVEMARNEKIVSQKRQEYAVNLKREEDDWLNKLSQLEDGENRIGEVVTNLSVVGIGDSVMLGAVPTLYQTFPNAYFDAEVSRTAWVVNDILQDLKNKNMIGEVVVLNLGTNGDCSKECKTEIMNTIGNRKVFWVNVNKGDDPNFNDSLSSFAQNYSNIYIVDWKTISQGHPEYFVSDGIHLTSSGMKAYSDAIYESIYQVYLEEYKIKKEEIIRNHDNTIQEKISFYGNDLLLNAFTYLSESFPEAKFTIEKELTYDKLKNFLQKDISNNTITSNLVFAFDNSSLLTFEDYQELITMCSNKKIYLLITNSDIYQKLSNIRNENITIIDFSNKEYLMADNIHLNEKGNMTLINVLKTFIK